MINRTKIIIGTVAFIVTLLFLWAVVDFIDGIGKHVVDIRVAPSDAKIVLDGKKNISNSQQKISSGKHTVRVTRDGFDSVDKTFTTSDSEVVIVAIGLVANNKEGSEYVNNHPEEFRLLEEAANKAYDQGAEKLTEDYPIIEQLPIDSTPRYRIDYGVSKKYPDDPSKIALYISANSSFYRRVALDVIYLAGFDPSDYEIIFQPLESDE
jgi:hypothetical protein